MPILGLIAGNRSFPIHAARSAKAQGYEVVAVGLKEETDPALEKEVSRMFWVSFSEIGKVPELLKEAGARDVLLAGQIRPERLLQGEGQWDGVVRQLLSLMPDRSGSSAMKMAVQYLEGKGFRVLHSGTFLKHWIPEPGTLTRRAPSAEEQADLQFGMKLARKLAGLGIGQTLVVRHKAVAAVEALRVPEARPHLGEVEHRERVLPSERDGAFVIGEGEAELLPRVLSLHFHPLPDARVGIPAVVEGHAEVRRPPHGLLEICERL
jgi:DUF1009 family protein